MGNNFTLEHFEGNKMIYKIICKIALNINEKDSTYRLINYVKRNIGDNDDILEITKDEKTLYFHLTWKI